MGPIHTSKSTRAKRGRSVSSSSKPRRSPSQSTEAATRKQHALREGINRFLDTDRFSPDAVHERPKPTRLATGAAVLSGTPTMTLQMVQAGLETVSALVSICAGVLDTQMADSDRDVAIVLQRCVLNTLERQREHIERLLKDGAS